MTFMKGQKMGEGKIVKREDGTEITVPVRATQTEKFDRIKRIEDMLTDGSTTNDIIHFASQNWGLTRRQAYHYMSVVMEHWVQISEKDHSKNRERAIRKREAILKRCIEKGDMASAHKWQQGLEKLQGLLVDNVHVDGILSLKAIRDE